MFRSPAHRLVALIWLGLATARAEPPSPPAAGGSAPSRGAAPAADPEAGSTAPEGAQRTTPATPTVAPPGGTSKKRSPPDYEGRPEESATAGEVLLWIPRVLLSPLYFTSEFLLRRPLGFVIAGAERAGVPSLLYDLFTFGPDNKMGVVPIGFIDFGFRPSVGVYAFWDDAFVEGNSLRLRGAFWGDDWLSASISDVVQLRGSGLNKVRFTVSGLRRPDYAFYGIGPSTRESARSRFGADSFSFSGVLDQRLFLSSALRAHAGVYTTAFRRGHFGDDPSLDELVIRGVVPAPPGYPDDLVIARSGLGVAFDSRLKRPAPGSGMRVELEGAHSAELETQTSWVQYGAAVGGFLDLNERSRVVALSARVRFADPIGDGEIPFTELVQLGGFAPMRGYFDGRLRGRSAFVTQLAYRWPIWIWLDGSMHFEVGNVFDEHLEGLSLGLMRFSGSIGFQSGSSDNSLEMLVGMGSETFESGGKIDSFRFLLGTTSGI